MRCWLGAGAGWAALIALLGCGEPARAPLRVGVMLPLTGADGYDPEPALEWARANINAAGGVAGRPLELVYRDLGKLDYHEVAQEFAADEQILAVIGPDQSRRVFDLAPQFIRAQKVMISPTSTSADVYRAYAGSGFVWRVTESDIAQIKTMLVLAQARGAERVSLLTSYDSYGATFFDAFGFYATELGLEVANIVRYEQAQGGPCADAVVQGLDGSPDFLFAVPTGGEDLVCIARAFAALAPEETRLFFTDVGHSPFLLDRLGVEAEGLEGTSLAPDQGSGFERAYREKHGKEAENFSAHYYDSLLLAALALERSSGRGGAALSEALKEVVDGLGEATTWDEGGVARALALLRQGELPDIAGATGPLSFDSERYTDLTFSTYMHWRVRGGRFEVVELLPTYEVVAGSQTIRENSIFESRASEARKQVLSSETVAREVPPRAGLWALIVASSFGFENYRHQADALALYRLLRERGVPDERIVLVLADDLADAPENPEPGIVRNAVGGPDLYGGVQIDHRLGDLSLPQLLDILRGRANEELPAPIAANDADDLLVFLVGHGGRQGLYYGVDRALDSAPDDAVLTPEQLADSLAERAAAGGFRRALVVVEACHGGVLGSALSELPGVLLLSGANAYEESLAFGYDSNSRIWRADQFAHALLSEAASDPEQSLASLYGRLYLDVSGSHVSVYNSFAFGDLAEVRLSEFLDP